MHRRHVFIVAILTSLFLNGVIRAQDQNNPDTLRKELADTLAQLKNAQDRKNELGNENEKLRAQLAVVQKQLEELQRASAGWAEETYALRSRDAAWTAFVNADPLLKARWELFLETPPPDIGRDLTDSPLKMHVPPSIQDFLAARPTTTTAPATMTTPTTTPTTAPSTIPVPTSQPATSPNHG